MHRRKASKSTLFLMELVLVILLFAFCAAICMGLFGASQKMTDDSDALNHAVAISRTAAGCYKAADGELACMLQLMDVPEEAVVQDEAVRIYYDTDWKPAPVSDAAFYLQITLFSDTDASLQEAELAVCHMDRTVIFQLPVKKAVLHTGGELYA